MAKKAAQSVEVVPPEEPTKKASKPKLVMKKKTTDPKTLTDEQRDAIEDPEPKKKPKPKSKDPIEAPPLRAKLPKEKKESNRVGRGTKGTKYGLNVAATWLKIMEANYKAKLTDEGLAALMQSEFPMAKNYTASYVAMIRAIFNRGQCKGQDGARPVDPLPKYDENRKPMPLRGSVKVEKITKKEKRRAAVKDDETEF